MIHSVVTPVENSPTCNYIVLYLLEEMWFLLDSPWWYSAMTSHIWRCCAQVFLTRSLTLLLFKNPLRKSLQIISHLSIFLSSPLSRTEEHPCHLLPSRCLPLSHGLLETHKCDYYFTNLAAQTGVIKLSGNWLNVKDVSFNRQFPEYFIFIGTIKIVGMI